MVSVFQGVIKKCKLILDNRHIFLEYLKSFKDGARVVVTVKRYRKDRTLQQNRYYWAVPVTILADHFGYTKDEMHDALRMMFLKKPEAKIPTVRSSTDLNTTEFTDYLESIWRWAATEYGINIPDPENVEY